ncbi:hypothetical protein J6590_028522 [Homalodisca vitripennis]|nr:hypothetical protein J6590_028522 [Homalodisca vitripennis]
MFVVVSSTDKKIIGRDKRKTKQKFPPDVSVISRRNYEEKGGQVLSYSGGCKIRASPCNLRGVCKLYRLPSPPFRARAS